MSSSGWVEKDAAIVAALAHARERRVCLAAGTRLGVELLNRRVAAGWLVMPFPHLYEEASYWQQLSVVEKALRVIRGAAQLHPDWVFCCTSAALAYGLEVSQPSPGVVHVATAPRAHSASMACVKRHAMTDVETCTADGVHVVSKAACVRGCLGMLDLPHGLAVADSFLRAEALTADYLVELARGIGCHRTRCHALKTALRADPLAENGGESVARGTMIELGFVVPELQVPIDNPVDAGHPFRVDFMWRGQEMDRPVIGELDGMDKYRDREMLQGRTTLQALSDERVRESRLTLVDASVMRFRFGDVLNRTGFVRLLDGFGVPRVSAGAC